MIPVPVCGAAAIALYWRPRIYNIVNTFSGMRGVSKTSVNCRTARVRVGFLLLGALWIAVGTTCTSSPPANVENICAIFAEKHGWFRAAQKSEERWGTPVHIQMSIIRQESSFRFDAKPPRTKLLGFIPWKRPSDAYGYAQALDSTWGWYKDDSGRQSADRDDFDDAIDFVGWYTNKSNKSVGISKWDPYNQYLAYHEDHAGWRGGAYQRKAWLKEIAVRVDYRAREWGTQLQRCEDDLHDGWWIF